MKVECPLPLLNHLTKKVTLHHLRQDLIICYPNQSIMTAVWLKKGTIRLNENMKGMIELTQPGLYFLDEVSSQYPCPSLVKILKGSDVWLVTRSDLQLYLVESIA